MNDIEKKTLRIFTRDKSDEYKEQLDASDEFALAEVDANIEALLLYYNEIKNNSEAQKEAIEKSLLKVYADLVTLEEYANSRTS